VELDAAWLEGAVVASRGAPPTALFGSAALIVNGETVITVEISDGRVVGQAAGPPGCEIPLNDDQVEALVTGSAELSADYMRGDLKPTGSTASILAALNALDSLH
jgi:hypothetical protein